MVISFIGLGEVGSTYSSGLAQNSAEVRGYDLLFETVGQEIFTKCKEAGVQLVNSLEELVEGADIIIAVTACSIAMETAETVKGYLKENQRYVELNSAVPQIKKEVAEYLGDSCKFVDGTTLSSPTQFGVATPIVMSGPYGKETADDLNSYGMNIKFLGDENGQASAFKVVRSIFTKGLESVLIECLTVAKDFGIENEIYQSIVAFLSDEPTEDTLALLVETDVLHSKRRGDEIREIAQMVEDLELDNTMSLAATKKLYYLSDMNLRERFNNEKADEMMDAIEAMLEFERRSKQEIGG